MSLPWFPFHVNAYVTDTMALTTEGHGAYLLLMLHYYATEKPLPDRDATLAAICKMPVDRWQALRPDIQTFFVVADGLWVHERVRDEIRNGHEKHSAKVARVAAATEAAARKAAERRSATESVTDPKSDKKQPRTRNQSANASINGPVTESVNQSVTDTHKQEQDIVVGLEGDAGAREERPPDSDPLNIDSPLGGAIPIDRWTPPPIDPADSDLFLAFANRHMDAGTFTDNWPALWDRERTEASLKPARKPPPARIELNKRPEQLPAHRVLISPAAFDLAKEVEVAMGVVGMPITNGMPATMEVWLAAWSPDVILMTIREVMGQRAERGETSAPRNLKYFENAIARAHADLKRTLPTAEPSSISSQDRTHGRRQTQSKSVPEAARRLADKLTALSGGGTVDGGAEGAIAGRTIPEIGSG